jgi:hypothetical protein
MSRRIGGDAGVAVLCCRPAGVDGGGMVGQKRHGEEAPAVERHQDVAQSSNNTKGGWDAPAATKSVVDN